MTSLTVELDDDAAARLRQQAERAGVTTGELARRLLTDAAADDPFDFFDAGSADALRGDRVDERLTEHNFGRQ